MTGIIYPNLIGTLAPLMAMDQADQRNAFEMARIKRQDEADARDQEAGKYFPAAVKGDPEAVAKVMANPKLALPLQQYLDRADVNKRTQLKEAAAWTSQAAMGVLSAPPEQRAAAYAAALADGKARGFDISSLPPQWSPDVEGRLTFHANQARDVNKYFEAQDNKPTPMGGPSGTGASGNAIGGIESGGRYDAVGPVANAQGNRAYGKYQVLDSNIGPWTQEVLGKPMTPQEFLANPQAQDAVFKAKFGQYEKKYGPEGAARAWFAGEGGMNNPNAKDVLGTTVAGYGQKFTAGLNPAGGATGGFAPPDVARSTAVPPGVAQGDNPGGMPGQGPDPLGPVRGLQLPPGARIMAIKGVPIIKDGTVQILKADGQPDFIPLPTRAEPKDQLTPGYRWNADRTAQDFIPGGPADPAVMARTTEAKRKADEKAIPQTVTKGIQENLNALKQLDRVDEELKRVPDSTGGVGSIIANSVPGANLIQSRMDPDGVKLRALIADIGSLKIHDRSGAAVTASEFPRLKPFIPQISDDAKTVAAKLANFRAVYDEVMRDTLEYYGPTNGFREYTPATRYIGSNQPNAGASAEQGRALFEARDAISKGAPRDAVVERLVKMGIDPSGL